MELHRRGQLLTLKANFGCVIRQTDPQLVSNRSVVAMVQLFHPTQFVRTYDYVTRLRFLCIDNEQHADKMMYLQVH